MSSRYAHLIAAVAAISGLLFGLDTAVINGALIFLRQELSLSTRDTEIATSSLLASSASSSSMVVPSVRLVVRLFTAIAE